MFLSRYSRKGTSLSLYTPTCPLSSLAKSHFPSGVVLPKLMVSEINNNTNNNYNNSNNSNNNNNNNNSNGNNNGGCFTNSAEEDDELDDHSNDPLVDSELPDVISFSANRQVLKGPVKIRSLPAMPPLSTDERFIPILQEKLNLCSLMFDFNDVKNQSKGIKAKGIALQEISVLVLNKTELLAIQSETISMMFKMIVTNLFEQDPFISSQFLAQKDSKLLDPSWPHLEVVFKILDNFMQAFPQKIDIELVEKAIYLMNLPDPRVQEGFVLFLLQFLTLNPDKLKEVWRLLQIALSNTNDGVYKPACVCPILASFMSIYTNNRTNGRLMLRNMLKLYLLPLYHLESLSLYSNLLTSIVLKAIDGFPDLQLTVVDYLIKSFPCQNGEKQHLYVKSIYSIIKNMTHNQLKPKAVSIINFMALCLKLPNSKLNEEILQFFNNKNIAPILSSNIKLVQETMSSSLALTSQSHWDRKIMEMADNAFSVVKRMTIQVAIPHSKRQIALINNKVEIISPTPCSNTTINSPNNTTINSPTCTTINCPTNTTINNPANNESMLSNGRSNDTIRCWALIARGAHHNDRAIDLTKSLQSIHISLLPINNENMSEMSFNSSRAPRTNTPLRYTNLTTHAQSQSYGKKI